MDQQIPAPTTQNIDHKSAVVRDVFFNLAMMSALYTAMTSFVFLISDVLNIVFPNQFSCGDCDFSASIGYLLPLVIVSYSLYAYFSWKARKNEGSQPTHHTSIFHQIVVYITLFLVGLAVAFQSVNIIYDFIYYGIVIHSIIKLLAMFLVAGLVFGYHLIDLKKAGDTAHSKIAITLWWVLSVIMAGAIIGSFLVIGSPLSQKEKRFDDIRSQSLTEIQSQIGDYYYDNDYAYPEDLSQLSFTFADPATLEPYEYIKNEDSYLICANFGNSSIADFQKSYMKVYGKNFEINEKERMADYYLHDKGRVCFETEIKKDPYGEDRVSDPYDPYNTGDTSTTTSFQFQGE